MRMLLPFSPVTARPARFGSIRGIVGTRDEILRLGERMMLCAEAGELPAPKNSDSAASKTIAGRIFSRQVVSTRVMGLRPQSAWQPAHGVATARLTIFSFCNLLRRFANSSFDVATLANCRRNMPPVAPPIIEA